MLIPFHQVHTQTNLEPEIKVYINEGGKQGGELFGMCVS